MGINDGAMGYRTFGCRPRPYGRHPLYHGKEEGSAEVCPDSAPSIDHIKALESEISGIRKLSAELERKKAVFERHEHTMGERTRSSDAAVNQAEESAKKLEARYLSEKNEEMYGRAVSMLKAGTLLTR